MGFGEAEAGTAGQAEGAASAEEQQSGAHAPPPRLQPGGWGIVSTGTQRQLGSGGSVSGWTDLGRARALGATTELWPGSTALGSARQ